MAGQDVEGMSIYRPDSPPDRPITPAELIFILLYSKNQSYENSSTAIKQHNEGMLTPYSSIQYIY